MTVLAVFMVWLFCLPKNLFNDPTSTVVTSSNGALMGARIAQDGQWRFPVLDSVPKRFEQCVLLFEDEHFYRHPGFNPVSLFHAIQHNLTQKTRRGGSTITQQVIRLSRKQKERTYLEKLIELFMATRLEARHSKKEILNMYAGHTPYGGNVVGLETASWRYFGIPAHELSWGQSATLAVLPNAPSLIFPGRNDQSLLKKRNRLLKKLKGKHIIDALTYDLAIAEPLPGKPLALPNIAPHLTERIKNTHEGKRIRTTIDLNLQQQANRLAQRHYKQLKGNEIHNLAILVLDVESRAVLSYVGNSPTGELHGNHVDIITKKRSSGSTLKPFLFASLLQEGQLLPNALVADLPTVINGYNPKNFNKKYNGAVTASKALSRSLNVPAVRLLQKYGLQKFYNKLQKMQLRSIDRAADHYGLPLILGGAESSLWDLTKTYASAASTLNHYIDRSSTYRANEFVDPSYYHGERLDFGTEQFKAPVLHASSIYHMFKALREVNRPEGDENWEFFSNAQPLAWKTGTSFGFKDAWAIGVTPKYAIGIWVGNADGEGRPGLTGITAAAPLLFDVLDVLPQSGWFQEPFDDLAELETCSDSGYLATPFCESTESALYPIKGIESDQCPYHKRLFLDASQSYQVHSGCYPLENMVHKNWFVLPAGMEYYYADANPNYRTPPPFLNTCNTIENQSMELIYPKPGEAVVLARDLGDAKEEIIFKLAHQQAESKVYWYLNDTFVGSTQTIHELILPINSGEYLLTVLDDSGNRLQQRLRVTTSSEHQ